MVSMYRCIFVNNGYSNTPLNLRNLKLTPGLPAALKMPLPPLAAR